MEKMSDDVLRIVLSFLSAKGKNKDKRGFKRFYKRSFTKNTE